MTGLDNIKSGRKVNCVVVSKKEMENRYKYGLAIQINKDYFNHIPIDNKLKSLNKYFMWYGKTISSKLNVNLGSIVQVMSDKIMKYDNGKYPYYKGKNTVLIGELQDKQSNIVELEKILLADKSEKKSEILLSGNRMPKLEDISCYKCSVCGERVVCGIDEDEARECICPYCGNLGLVKLSLNVDEDEVKKD